MIQRPVRLSRLVQAAAIAIAMLASPANVRADDPNPHFEEVQSALAAWDLPTAKSEAEAIPSGPQRDVADGVIAVYEGNYERAESLLGGALAAGDLPEGGPTEEAKHYLALARGSTKAMADAITVRSDDGTVEAVFADEKDALIAPYLFEAMAKAREVLGDELGVRPDHAVRFEFLDDPLKLAMITPLTTENIRTTGTVGVTKYRRIMMISPRIMLFGYGWLDTAVHEYVHYLITLRTKNNAPVWLQEGLAKLLETRWRTDTPEALAAPIAYRLNKAIVADELVTLEQMYPSVAMLPSQELAALAYAEVQTMLELVRQRRGAAGIERLLDRVAAGDDAKDALATAWGDDFEAFMTEWKRVTRRRTAAGVEGPLATREFKEGDDAPAEELGDVFSHLGGGKARQHARLGTLLQQRDHAVAATMQYEKARAEDARARTDPLLSRRLGKLYNELSFFDRAVPLLDIAAKDKPEDANLAAAQGHARLKTGDTEGAREAIDRALRVNPFIPTLHCDLVELAPDEATRTREQSYCRATP